MSALSASTLRRPTIDLAVDRHRRCGVHPRGECRACLGAGGRLLLPRRDTRLPGRDIEARGRGEGGQTRRGERTLVLPGLVREDPILERPVVVLIRRTATARGGLDRLVVGGAALLALEGGIVVDDPERARSHVLGDQCRFDGPGVLTTDRALEIGPHLQGDRSLGLAEGSSIGERDRRGARGSRQGRGLGLRLAAPEQEQTADQQDAEAPDHGGDEEDRRAAARGRRLGYRRSASAFRAARATGRPHGSILVGCSSGRLPVWPWAWTCERLPRHDDSITAAGRRR